MKKAIASTKDFVLKNKTPLIICGVLTSVIALQHSGIKSLNAFLVEKDLFDEYYTVES